MFKKISAMFRGLAWNAAEDVTDRHAVVILDQQIRDCARALDAARRAVAFAEAQSAQEKRRQAKLGQRIADLESRTMAAMEAGKDELAREAATAIAQLEAERDACEPAAGEFEREILRLRQTVKTAADRLSALKRGQRVARATNRVQKLRETSGHDGLSSLRDAEETLERLRLRQQQIDIAADALDGLSRENDPAAIAEKLAEAGCGAPLKSTADDVLARLADRKSERKAG